jgi:hypothetical protein
MSKFIKLKNTDGKEVLINLSNVTHLFSLNENETSICFITYEDYVKVPYSIKVLEQGLDAIDDSRNVWVF